MLFHLFLPIMPGAIWSFSSFFLLLSFLHRALALLTNRTIDDTLGDGLSGFKPVYTPDTPGVWKLQSCIDCLVIPDTTKALHETYHSATTSHPAETAIELQFTGTAIYIYFILPKLTANADTGVACNFSLDGVSVGNFILPPSPSLDDTFDALVFSQTDFANISHNFRISTGGLDHNVLTIFDYAIYTFDDSPALTVTTTADEDICSSGTSTAASNDRQISQTPPAQQLQTKRSVPIGGIVGATVSVSVLLPILVMAFIVCKRRRTTRIPQPFGEEAKKSPLRSSPQAGAPGAPGLRFPERGSPYYYQQSDHPLPTALPSSVFLHSSQANAFPDGRNGNTTNHVTVLLSPPAVPVGKHSASLDSPPLAHAQRTDPKSAHRSSARPLLRIQTDMSVSRVHRNHGKGTQHRRGKAPKPQLSGGPIPSSSTTTSRAVSARKSVSGKMKKQIEAMQRRKHGHDVDSEYPPQYFSPTIRQVRNP